MKLSMSIAALTLAAVLSGCASTSGSPEGTTQAGLTAATGGTSADSNGVTGRTGDGTPIGSESANGKGAHASPPDLKRSVYYEFDNFDVKPEYRALVESHARWLSANPSARIAIEGNADERGSREYNVSLGQRRAESVTRMMVILGVDPEQIEAVSFGAEKPRASGHDEAAWAENRRSDFANR